MFTSFELFDDHCSLLKLNYIQYKVSKRKISVQHFAIISVVHEPNF